MYFKDLCKILKPVGRQITLQISMKEAVDVPRSFLLPLETYPTDLFCEVYIIPNQKTYRKFGVLVIMLQEQT